jgi:hypothetical protein
MGWIHGNTLKPLLKQLRDGNFIKVLIQATGRGPATGLKFWDCCRVETKDALALRLHLLITIRIDRATVI